MWPRDADEWIGVAGLAVTGTVESILETYPVTRGLVRDILPAVVERVRDEATALQLYRGFFPNMRNLASWAAIQGRRFAITSAVDHSRVRHWFERLPTEQFRVLRWCYVDHLTLADLVRLLPSPERSQILTSREARSQIRVAHTALSRLLLRTWPGNFSFPEPEQLRHDAV